MNPVHAFTLLFLLLAPTVPALEFAAVVPGYAYRFPKDHGSHDAFRIEWWYFTAIVDGRTAAGENRRFGIQLTFFRTRRDLGPAESNPSAFTPRQLWFGHLAVTDPVVGVMLRERRARGGLGRAGGSTEGLDLLLEGWGWNGSDGIMRLAAAADGAGISLEAMPAGKPWIHGTDGVSRKGPGEGQASHYVTFPRLRVSGKLQLRGRKWSVRGSGWMDHEWSSQPLAPDQVGWDWVGLRLEDGSALMVYRLRRADGGTAWISGSLLTADRRPVSLSGEEILLESGDVWRSPESGIAYPVEWRLRIPRHGIDLELLPWRLDQELITTGSTGVTYWEGPVRVQGSHAGEGYLEMTGYDQSLKQMLEP